MHGVSALNPFGVVLIQNLTMWGLDFYKYGLKPIGL